MFVSDFNCYDIIVVTSVDYSIPTISIGRRFIQYDANFLIRSDSPHFRTKKSRLSGA